MTRSRRGAVDRSRSKTASSTVGQSRPSPITGANASARWRSSWPLERSHDSHRYQATGTPALDANLATRVVLPEPAGATSRPRRRPQSRLMTASSRTRPYESAAGTRSLAATNGVPVSGSMVRGIFTTSGPPNVGRGGMCGLCPGKGGRLGSREAHCTGELETHEVEHVAVARTHVPVVVRVVAAAECEHDLRACPRSHDETDAGARRGCAIPEGGEGACLQPEVVAEVGTVVGVRPAVGAVIGDASRCGPEVESAHRDDGRTVAIWRERDRLHDQWRRRWQCGAGRRSRTR